MQKNTTIQGTVAPEFKAVADVFQSLFNEGRELGSSVCVYHKGKPVVDLWGGLAAPTKWFKSAPAWNHDTITYLASATKVVPALVTHYLAQQGKLSIDAPIADYWPEFGVNGKESITIRMLLNHTAGVVTLEKPFGLREMELGTPIAESIASQSPVWEPGMKHGYHATTFGFGLAEIVRRVTGKTIGKYFADVIATPRHIDVYVGLSQSEVPRMAKLKSPSFQQMIRATKSPEYSTFSKAMRDHSSLFYRATFETTSISFRDVDDPRMYLCEEPTGGAMGSGSGLAKLYASMIDVVDDMPVLLNGRTIDMVCTAETDNTDQILQLETTYGPGFLLPGGGMWPAFGVQRAFGYPGATGSLGFADPDNHIAFGYVPNKMTGFIEGTDKRAEQLVAAVYKSLGH